LDLIGETTVTVGFLLITSDRKDTTFGLLTYPIKQENQMYYSKPYPYYPYYHRRRYYDYYDYYRCNPYYGRYCPYYSFYPYYY